jgi:hypothetical protein
MIFVDEADISDDSFSYICEEASVRQVLEAIELPANLEMYVRCVNDYINGVKIVEVDKIDKF